MSDVERTPAGLQGCERRTLPQSITRVDEADQGLLGFYKPPSLREQLAVRADAPLRPRRGLSSQAVHDGRPVKIRTANTGVRDLSVYCADYECIHNVKMASAAVNRWFG